MSNNASIPPSSSNPLGSIENRNEEKIEPYYFVESDEVEEKQQTEEPEEEQEQQKEESEEEQSSELLTADSVPLTDLLQKRIEQFKVNEPKSKEEFYQRSYQIFAKLNNCVKGNDPNTVKDSKKQQISLIVSEYVDLVHEYSTTAKLIPLLDLSNLLYFNTEEESNLINDLNDWINEHDPILDHTEDEEYDEGQQDYSWTWETARRHLLRGNFVEAVDTLETALLELDETDSIAVKKIIQLVQKYDTLQQQKQHDHVYAEKWTDWHEACEAELQKFMHVRDEGFKEIDDEIRMIYSILAGVEQDIFVSGTYFERVLGSILYARPAITMSGLHHLAQHAVYNDKSVDECAYILMGCFDDAFEAQHDLWLQTHLGHALIAVGAKISNCLDNVKMSEDQEAIIDPIYYCIDAYATEIAEKYSMWTEAVVYISACVENREIWTKKLVGDPPLESKDTNLLKSILHISEQQNMPIIQKYIHRAIGQRHEENKDIKQATIEYGKAQDLKSLDRFAHDEFNQYLKTGKLQNVVTDMKELKASPHYAILITYQQFKAHLEKKDWESSFKLVLELLKSENLPSKFETVLLIDNLVILEDTKKYYNEKEMSQLLKIFKQITKDKANEPFFGHYYKHVYHHELSGSIVVAKLRERMAYEAATAAAR